MKITLIGALLLASCASVMPLPTTPNWRDAISTCVRIVGARTPQVGGVLVADWCGQNEQIEAFAELNTATDELVGGLLDWKGTE